MLGTCVVSIYAGKGISYSVENFIKVNNLGAFIYKKTQNTIIKYADNQEFFVD